ncbi:MAG: alpha/beta fold hydrolase [Cyanobacteria bacterium J06597_16]
MNILLIHGLGRTPLSMWPLSKALQAAGHTTELFGYTTVIQSFDDIAQRLRDHLQSLSSEGPYGIVSHSMGGVLTRAALADATFPLPAHVVMLAPPNQSPLAGRLAYRLPPFRWFAGQSGDNLASRDFYTRLPALNCPYTLVAGTLGPVGAWSPFDNVPNDLIVGLEEVKMQPGDKVVTVAALHSFIMNNAKVQNVTVQAFAKE